MIEVLISHGANLNARTIHNDLPLTIALRENQIEVVEKVAKDVNLNENPALFH